MCSGSAQLNAPVGHQVPSPVADAREVAACAAGSRAKPGTGQQQPAGPDQVSLTLVDRAGHHHAGRAVREEPALVMRRLLGPLGVAEQGPQDDAIDHGAGVGREHHVRQARLGLDHLHGVPERAIGTGQRCPLGHRPGSVQSV